MVFPKYSTNKASKLISSKDLDHGTLDLLLSGSFNAVVKGSVPLCFNNIYTLMTESYIHTALLQLEAPGLHHIWLTLYMLAQ